jgi:phage gp45-like
MNLWNLLRRALFRGLKEGPVQTVRVEVFDINGRDDAERWQDYGFASNPVDGQGLLIEAGGHTVVLRMDRIDTRPRLQPFEVAVWHKDGHSILLQDGGKISVKCTDFEVEASNGVKFTTPKVATSEALEVGTRAEIKEGASIASIEFVDHAHTNVQHGNDNSGGVAR